MGQTVPTHMARDILSRFFAFRFCRRAVFSAAYDPPSLA
jgi:hypothetical protein